MTADEILLYISLISSTLFIVDEFLGWSSCAANCVSQLIVNGFCVQVRDDSTSMDEIVIM